MQRTNAPAGNKHEIITEIIHTSQGEQLKTGHLQELVTLIFKSLVQVCY